MSARDRFRGVTAREERDARQFRRDTRTMGQKLRAAIENPYNVGMAMFGMAVIGFLAPPFAHATPLVAALLLFWHLPMREHRHLPLRLPKSAQMPDYNHPFPGRTQYQNAGGIVHIGNDVERGGQEVWLAKGDALTHDLTLGVTGAGKTVMLTGTSANYISMGGGLIYVDAKAAPSLPFDVYALIHRVGMEDDFSIINYMTGNKSVGGASTAKRMSNTTNPFASGSADSLVEVMSSLITAPQGENAVFGERALSMITAVLYGLVDLRDNGYIDLGVEVFRDYLPIAQVEALTFDDRLRSPVAKAALLAYMRSLPGYKAPDERAKKDRAGNPQMGADGNPVLEPIADEANRQHGFAQMYFTRALSSLTDTYGHIYRGSLGEVDFVDVVRRRRVLVVMLPALEKSLASLANLGKINLSAIKDAISTGLGGSIEGTRRDILETLPTASPIPNKLIMDEYGYMAVEGMAVVAAQARGLGWSVSFAGQDWAGIKRGSEIEANQIWGNTNLKVFGKLQDQESYTKLAEAAGESTVTTTGGFELGQALSAGYVDTLSASVEKRGRTDTTDLQSQIEGEAHIVYNGRLMRVQMFYANPKPVKELPINRYLRVGEKRIAGSEGVQVSDAAGTPKPSAQSQSQSQPDGGTVLDASTRAPVAEEYPVAPRTPRTPQPPQPPQPPPPTAETRPEAAVAPVGAQVTNVPHRSMQDVFALMNPDDIAADAEEDSAAGIAPDPVPTPDQTLRSMLVEMLPEDEDEETEGDGLDPDDLAAIAEAQENDPDRMGAFFEDDDLNVSTTRVDLAASLDAGTMDRKLLETQVQAAIQSHPSPDAVAGMRDITPDVVAANLRELIQTIVGDGGPGAR